MAPQPFNTTGKATRSFPCNESTGAEPIVKISMTTVESNEVWLIRVHILLCHNRKCILVGANQCISLREFWAGKKGLEDPIF